MGEDIAKGVEIDGLAHFPISINFSFGALEIHVIRNSYCERFSMVCGEMPLSPGVVPHSTIFDEMINRVDLGIRVQVK